MRELRSYFSKKEKINERKLKKFNKLGLTKKEEQGERNRKKIINCWKKKRNKK